ncbi:hypothetical protein KC330_g5103 [Hortaea werneckii]|nr:hypothetical protein KC330_g5103 [Hortaea werneckii]
MSKKQFKSQASSGRVGAGFGAFGSGFGSAQSSSLSYIQEPLDFSGISDANVVVAFKNLSKKDSTTKAKALEDIQSHVASDVEVEEGLLEAWVKLYPRLSIDNARRVRQLAHALNGLICSKCGKRTAKHLPRIAASWLAGTYDGDKAAARAAQEALGSVFPTPEKVAGLRKTFHASILEYCRDAALHESVQTLSDERTVSADDAQSTYARVISTSLSVVTALLGSLPEDEISKQYHVYEELFGESKLWEFANHSDAGVRRSTHRLVQLAIAKQPTLVEANLKAASAAYVYKGLPSDQTASGADYIATLDVLTSSFPSVWTDAYSAKKSAASRLRQFLKQGSGSGSADFWEKSSHLLEKIPDAVIPTGIEEARDLILAARDGVARKEERFITSATWPAYFALFRKVLKQLSEQDRIALRDSCVMPVIEQYLFPSPETSEWTISGAKAASVVAQAARIPGIPDSLEHTWPQMADKLVDIAKMSQPQQSKDFEKSQKHVAASGERWAALQRELFSQQELSSLHKTFVDSNTKVVQACAHLLETREGKPYGAAAIIEELLRTCSTHLTSDPDFKAALEQLLNNENIDWASWPSRKQLIHTLYAFSTEDFFSKAFAAALHQVIERKESDDQACKALLEVFPRTTPAKAIEIAEQDDVLQTFVLNISQAGPRELESSLFMDLYRLGALAQSTVDLTLSSLVTSLNVTDDTENVPRTLDFFTRTDDSTLKAVAASKSGEQLLPNLLKLEQHDDHDIAEKAAAMSHRLSSAGADAPLSAKFGIVLQNLESTSRTSLSIDAVHDLTMRLLGPERKVQELKEMMPSLDSWKTSLMAVAGIPRHSLAILSPLGGAIHLVHDDKSADDKRIQVDAEGLSQPLRIAMYVSKLLSDTDTKAHLSELQSDKWAVIALLMTTVLFAEDNLSVLGCNSMWNPENSSDVEPMVLDFVSEANATLKEIWTEITPKLPPSADGSSDYSQLVSALEGLREESGSTSALRYYSYSALARLNSNLFELHGHNADHVKASEDMLKAERSNKDTMATMACIVGLQQPLAGAQTLTRFCNELVADLTDLDMSQSTQELQALEKLVSLNCILHTQEEAAEAIAKQRLIFVVKRLIPALSTETTGKLKAEICKALTVLLPGMQDMYGEHWMQVLSYITSIWSAGDGLGGEQSVDDGRVLLAHASLKIFMTLSRLSKAEEANDDLVDAMKEESGRMHDALVTLLKSENGVSDETHQPLMLTHELLGRTLAQLPGKIVSDADELYPLLYTQSRPVQQAAFGLLHKVIPAAQEEVSLNAALDNKTAHLPDELLSLVLEPPTLDSLVDASFDRTMPLQLQGYLYSWRLLFDHFTNSSYRVKTDYIEQLKDGAYMPGLLSFIFDFLGHTRGKPVDASRFEVQEYVADVEPSPERDVQWLLTHLYYLALMQTPSLVKGYYLDIRSRQTSLAVESWTAKYISPLIVTTSLQSVAEWSEKSVKEDPEYEKMAVKVGMRSKEVNVSYVVDEQTMAIKVALPDAYPLASAQVLGVSRVAVKEEKWQSWLRNCQGVITFSNGSIIDGLSAWRKNVTGALKGQTECAICYSIIDSQKQLPTKRCPTCKNTFHSSCLFKWFKTSNASTCPLCRNAFNFN